MIVIENAELVKRIEQIAEQEHRTVEEVLETALTQYASKSRLPISSEELDIPKTVHEVRLKTYRKARQYWQSVGDTEKASLSDEEMAEQFGAFDEMGIPRLKNELDDEEPPPGSLAYAANVIREMESIPLDETVDVTKIDEILDEMADDLLPYENRRNDNQNTIL